MLMEGVAWPNKGEAFWEHSPRLTPVPLAQEALQAIWLPAG